MREGLQDDAEASREEFENVLVLDEVKDQPWRICNYEILEEIGRGGMGVIYRARQRHSRRIVALKRVLSYQAESRETLRRFRLEAQAAANLDHPNILPIYEVGETDDGLPYFSMKLAVGGTLLDLKRALRGDAREVVATMAKITRAVKYAHSQGILHRDLKPGNILLDARGEPLVSDFGLAKWLDGSGDLTRTLTIFGTPGYIAPEQARGAGDTVAADIYSLGAILFDLLTGRPPFLGEHALAVIKQAEEKPAPRLRSLVRNADRDLETICAKCLEREPRARYQSASEVADDLERWLAHRPIRARRILPPTRAWRWSRRNPHIIATAATCLALGAAAIWLLRSPAEKPATNLPPEKSVAVLPFESLNNDQDNGLLASGIQDDVLNDLAKIADLKVIGANSVREYKAGTPRNLRQIAQTLGVRNIVEGSVQRIGTRVRVSARLIDTTARKQFWRQQYDREPENIFGIESELAKSIAGQLQVNLSPLEKAAIEQQPTADLQAYQLYVQAKDLLRTSDQRKTITEAVELLEQATQRDPNFSLAYSQLVIAHTWSYDLGDRSDDERAAKQAMDTALRLAPDLSATHLAIARYYATFLKDNQAARRELTIALRTLPNDGDALLYCALADRRLGRWDDAVAELRKAAVLNPKDITTINVVWDTYIALRRYREAEDFLKQELVRAPEFAKSYLPLFLIQTYLQEGALERAKTYLASVATDLSPEEYTRYRYVLAVKSRDMAAARQAMSAYPNGFNCFGVHLPFHFFEGEMALAQRDIATARAAFAEAYSDLVKEWGAEPSHQHELVVLARTEAVLGDSNAAIRHARHAAELFPISKDVLDGVDYAANLAIVYACAGERELALKQLEEVAKLPFGPPYGDLKYDVWWDNLRGDPRFEQIVASLAPKEKL